MKPKLIDATKVPDLIPDGATLCLGGGGAGHAVPDTLIESLGRSFVERQRPRDLMILHPCGIGDNDQRGLNHLAHAGLARRVIGGFWGNAPSMVTLAQDEQLEGYNFPQGVLTHLVRATAGGRPGVLTTTGLHTFIDPDLEGGKLNSRTTEDLVVRVKIDGKLYLLYKSIPFHYAFIRGTSLDRHGNLTMEDEVATFAMLSIAQAAKVNGGTVIAQVKRITKEHATPERVKVPAALIDYVVVEPERGMTFITQHDPAMIDREAPSHETINIDGIKKVISRRAALDVRPGMFLNVGYGMADGVPIVLRDEGKLDEVTFFIEQGAVGGIPTTGLNFGAMYNPHAILDDGYQFDFFHGGGLDCAFLGFAQVDQYGNVNSSKFGNKLTGCGGFIDISQNANNVVFCGSFAVKAQMDVVDGGLHIEYPGKYKKFISDVEQVTFSGPYAVEQQKPILYVTERAVFELTPKGLLLKEIAPGVDIQTDILELMEFEPLIPQAPALMDKRCFTDVPLFEEDV